MKTPRRIMRYGAFLCLIQKINSNDAVFTTIKDRVIFRIIAFAAE